MTYCSKCGNELNEDENFCGKCGTLNRFYQKTREKTEDAKKPVDKPKEPEIPNFNKIKKILIPSAIAAAALVVLLCVFLNPFIQFKNNVEGGRYNQAIQVYSRNMNGNLQDEQEVRDYLIERINAIKNDYYFGKTDYNTAKFKLDTIRNLDLLADEEIKPIAESIEKLNASQIAFETAQSYIANNNYAQAIIQLKSVIEEDENYAKTSEQFEQIKSQYKSEQLSKADDLAGTGNYEDAITLLNDSLKILPNDSDLTAKLNTIQTSKKEDDIEIGLRKAEELVVEKKYSEAFKMINSLIKDSPGNSTLTSKLTEYQNQYTNDLITQADALAQQGKYQEAIQILQMGLALLPEDDTLTADINRITEYLPINMKDMQTISISIEDDLWDGKQWRYIDSFSTNRGETFSNCFVSFNDGTTVYGFYNPFEIVYALDGKYNRFVAKAGVGSKATDKSRQYVGDFSFYADGNLIYSTGEIYSDMATPIDITIDLTGVKDFKITGHGSNIEQGVALLSPAFYIK